MGSSQSLLSSEAAITLVVVAGAIGLGYKQLAPATSATSTPPSTTAEPSGKKGKKKAKKQASPSVSQVDTSASPQTPAVVPFPAVIPGGFDGTMAEEAEAAPEASKRPKSKKKKGKLASSTSSAQPEAAAPKAVVASQPLSEKPAKGKQPIREETPPAPAPNAPPEIRTLKQSFQSSASIDTDSSWTRVESRRRREGPSAELTTSASEADAATPATGSSSPVAERTDDDEHIYTSRSVTEPRRPLAERLLPKPRKTGVDDMLETPDHPPLARVMHIQPRPDEKPASGFSWGDYEDVRNDADVDGEDDDAGWGVVKSRRSRPERTGATPSSSQTPSHAQKAPETLTKRQRQNANKRDVQKAAKAQAEEERLSALAKHKRTLEHERMMEQQQQQQRVGGGKKTSGGMTATVDERGKLVWE